MRVFVDTNVIMEAVLRRNNAVVAQQTLLKIKEEKIAAYISTQSFCTMIYLLDRGLKEVGIHNPEKLDKLRNSLRNLLKCFKISELSSKNLLEAVNDYSFSDIEDACQYKAAEKAKCNMLITFNISDYNKAQGSVLAITPADFLGL